MRRLLRQGALPHLESLIKRGVSAELATGQPLVSPALWTSAMTGRPAEEHGVAAWSEPRPDFAGVQPTSSLSRKTKALWNIASQAGLASHAMGHFAGFPVDSLSGVSVSNRPDLNLPGAMHPTDLASTLQELRVQPAEIDGVALAPFVPLGHRIDLETDGRPAFLASVLSETATQQARLTWVLQNRRWEFATALFGGLAKITGAFGAYCPPQNPRVLPEDFEIYRSVVDGAYRFFDRMLGAVLALAGPETSVLLMSVAGFRLEAIPPTGRFPVERTESWRRARRSRSGRTRTASWRQVEGTTRLGCGLDSAVAVGAARG